MAILLIVGWGVVGLAAGYGVRRLSVWLARLEELEPGFQRWKVIGPVILTAALFAAFAFVAGLHWQLLLYSFWACVLVQVIFFDLEYRLILDRVMFPCMVLALVLSLFFGRPWWAGIATGIGAGLVFLAIALLGSMAMKTEAMGFGDVKFAFFIGLLLGFPGAVTALFLGIILAGVMALLALVTRVVALKGSLAYGPFLAIGALIVLYQAAGGAPTY